MAFTLATLEPVLLPIISPLVLQLWQQTLLPAIQAEAAKVENTEAKIAVDAMIAAVDQIVQKECAQLATGKL